MGNKGPIDVVVEAPAVNEIIVFANQYRQEILEATSTITAACQRMTEEESLNGGDGEEIKANFQTIAAGCVTLEKSVKVMVDGLNKNLESIIKMSKGTTTAASSVAAKSASNKMGVFKKE